MICTTTAALEMCLGQDSMMEPNAHQNDFEIRSYPSPRLVTTQSKRAQPALIFNP